MRPIMRIAAAFAAMTLVSILGGCGDSPPSVSSSNTEVTVKGIVKIDGVPAKEGEVIFDPANISRPNAVATTAPIGKDGSYSIKTLVGENTIKIGGKVAKSNPILQKTRLNFVATSGENTKDIEISTK